MLEENGGDKMVENVTIELVIELIGEKRTLLNNILGRKSNWIGHILKIYCLLSLPLKDR